MDKLLLDKILDILPGIKTEMKDRILYLSEINDMNDFIKLKYALINLEKNSYKESTKIYLDITNYLKNNDLCSFNVINDKWYVSDIKSLDIIHIIYTYKMLNESSPYIELEVSNLNKTDVHNIIKQYVNKINYDYIMPSIKLILDK